MMSRVMGKVLAKETGAGVPDLIIVIYDLDLETTPEEILQLVEQNSHPDFWQKIAGHRLGSLLTDEEGHFELEYEEGAPSKDDRVLHPNLALFVLTPEDPSLEPCQKMLHVSCGATPKAGRTESFLIKLPLKMLLTAGVTVPQVPTGLWENFEGEELLLAMKKFTEKHRPAEQAEKSFPTRYKEQQKKLAAAPGQPHQLPRPPQSFHLALPVRLTNGEDLISDAGFIQDEETGQLLFKAGHDEQPIPLTFKGVRYIEDLPAARIPTNDSCFLVDTDKREFHICVPHSPNKLVPEHGEPSELHTWYTQQHLAV